MCLLNFFTNDPLALLTRWCSPCGPCPLDEHFSSAMTVINRTTLVLNEPSKQLVLPRLVVQVWPPEWTTITKITAGGSCETYETTSVDDAGSLCVAFIVFKSWLSRQLKRWSKTKSHGEEVMSVQTGAGTLNMMPSRKIIRKSSSACGVFQCWNVIPWAIVYQYSAQFTLKRKVRAQLSEGSRHSRCWCSWKTGSAHKGEVVLSSDRTSHFRMVAQQISRQKPHPHRIHC